jgi:hypothetical protein
MFFFAYCFFLLIVYSVDIVLLIFNKGSEYLFEKSKSTKELYAKSPNKLVFYPAITLFYILKKANG